MKSRRFSAVLGTISRSLQVAVLTVTPALAQDTTASVGAGTLVTYTVGVPGWRSEVLAELFTLGVHVGSARPNRLSPEVAFGVAPRVLVAGALAYGVRPGLAVPIAPTPHLLVVPSAGISIVGVAAQGGGEALIGASGGLAFVILPKTASGLRVGMTWHAFHDASEALWLLEFGVVRR
jgi:hypothetical protein